MNKNLKNSLKRLWSGWVKPVVLTLAVITPIKSSLADYNQVPTGSMKPTILEGDRILVNKLAYDLKFPLTTWHIAQWGDPQRGDIVVCYSPIDGTRLVKRVVAIPGDTIAMHNSRLLINGTPASYTPLDPAVAKLIPEEEQPAHLLAEECVDGFSHAMMLTPAIPSRRSFAEISVPEAQYFLMGDHRDNSMDSRFFGFVEREQIIGKASTVVASFDPDHYHFPRKNRWLEKLR